jgi:hypothetical protein
MMETWKSIRTRSSSPDECGKISQPKSIDFAVEFVALQSIDLLYKSGGSCFLTKGFLDNVLFLPLFFHVDPVVIISFTEHCGLQNFFGHSDNGGTLLGNINS